MKKIIEYVIVSSFIVVILFILSVKFLSAHEGDFAPDFETNLHDGTKFRLSELRGNYVLLNFWGSWCPPCRKENPLLVELYEKHSRELNVVSIALEKDSLNWKKVAEKDGFSWQYQIVSYNKLVLLSPIARKYGVTEIPAKFLINPKGKIVGELSFKQIDSLLLSLNN